MSPLPAQMQDHWALEPGARPARAQLIWFIPVSGCQQITELARLGQERLADLDGLDFVPAEWLHITTRLATGREGRLHTDPWTPHVTIAYGNSVRPAKPAIDAPGLKLPARQAVISSVSLTSQTPEQRWTWDLIGTAALGTRTSIR